MTRRGTRTQESVKRPTVRPSGSTFYLLVAAVRVRLLAPEGKRVGNHRIRVHVCDGAALEGTDDVESSLELLADILRGLFVRGSLLTL